MTPFDPLKRPKTPNPLLPTTESAVPRPGAPVTAYGAGAATRDAVGAGIGVLADASRVKTGLAGIAQNAVAAPIEGFTRGLFGASRTPVTQGGGGGAAPTVARPQFGNVVGKTDTVAAPARNPADNPQSSVAGNVGGVPAPLKPGDANTFTGVNGVTRAVPGMDARPAGVPAQSFGGLSMPAAASVAPQPTLGVNLPRPTSAGSPYALHEARDANAAMLSKLDSANFAASVAAPHSHGARELQGRILGQMADLSNANLNSATGIAGGDRDAANAVNLAGVNQQGDNQRALLKDTGDTNRINIGEAGTNARTQFTTLADFQKPGTITDINGNVLSVVGNTATPITADGKPVRAATPKIDRPDANTILTAYTAQQKSLEEAAALTGKPADYSALESSPLGRAYQQVLNPGPPAEHIAMLRADPKLAAKFDEHYGAGAADRYLAGGSK